MPPRHKRTPKITVVPKLHDGDEELIRGCAPMFAPPSSPRCDVFVRPLGRWGYTNSRLYRVAFNREESRPFVIKTDFVMEMDREARGLLNALNLPGAEQAKRWPADHAKPCRAIGYPLISRHGKVDDIKELSEVMYDRSPARCYKSVRLLDSLYDSVARYNEPVLKKFNYGTEYKRYLRETTRRRKLLNPLSDFFGSSDSECRHGSLTLRNPRRILEAVKSRTMQSPARVVHGDLHPKNVLIDHENKPNLIDFAYGDHRGHWVKDFVLMELSVRFVEPPPLLQPDALLIADQALLEETGADGVRDIAGTTSAARTAEVLREMASLVETIRRKCRESSPGYDFTEYLTAMYLMLMGCIRLKSYQDFRVMLALCDLADHLERKLGLA